MKHRLLLGAHMSIADSIDQSFDRAQSIGCTTMQIFVKSNRQWFTAPLADEKIIAFRQKAKSSSVNPIVAHTAYLINLGSPHDDVAEKSLKSFTEELQRAEVLGIPYLVVHPGAALDGDEKTALKKTSAGINEALKKVHGSTIILLETMAGQGSTLGATFEQIAAIIDDIHDKKRIGVCFDTCHTWAAGYDASTHQKYEKMWNLFDTTIGLKKLYCLHLNDSKNECGTHVDRHEDIGKGKIGLELFKLLMNDERFFDIPKILETPKCDPADDKRNIKTLVSLISPKSHQQLIIEKELLGSD